LILAQARVFINILIKILTDGRADDSSGHWEATPQVGRLHSSLRRVRMAEGLGTIVKGISKETLITTLALI